LPPFVTVWKWGEGRLSISARGLRCTKAADGSGFAF